MEPPQRTSQRLQTLLELRLRRSLEALFRPIDFVFLNCTLACDSAIHNTLRVHLPIDSNERGVHDGALVSASVKQGGVQITSMYSSVLMPPAMLARWMDPEGFASQSRKTYSGQDGKKIDIGFGFVSKGIKSPAPHESFGAGKALLLRRNGSLG
ncbi:hypothetical protein K523DRAFT_357727 [Schizophyllum commune Tattone D]|nr:hypothetical protein K523DRAFT_357727 [Schizophyllum commune Tattone D]